MNRRLAEFEPFHISANVRRELPVGDLCVAEGIGRVGDLVLGEVMGSTETPLTVYDQKLDVHTFTRPTRIVATLGTRLSTTHVNAGIPEGGLQVSAGSMVHWIAGESGLVGQLLHEADPNTPFKAETSAGFRLEGLLKRADSEAAFSIRDLAVTPSSTRLTAPILMVGATAAEAGKTTLTRRIIQHLISTGRRVAAVKVTGTGGTMDSQEHRAAGAFLAVDQVDAGLITTYCSPEPFRERILLSFLHAQDHDPDIIVAELGGDLTFANNPTFLTMPEVRAAMAGLVVISSDPLSCYGVNHFLTHELDVPQELTHHFAAPFRNPAGMKARAAVMGVQAVYDPNNQAEIEGVVEAIVSAK